MTEERVECGGVPCREDYERRETVARLIFWVLAFLGSFVRSVGVLLHDVLLSTVQRLGRPMILGCFVNVAQISCRLLNN